jgi:nucleoside-diphosphate-sugar epimerase
MSNEGLGQTINLGSNFEISIRDIAKLISELMGTNVKILSDEERIRPDNSEVERLWADNSKAKDFFAWEPEYKGFEGLKDGLVKTINWFSQAENLNRYKSEIYNL